MINVIKTYSQEQKSTNASLIHKPFVNKVTERAKSTHKCCQPLEHLTYCEKGFGSFNTDSMGSVDQRSVRLLSIKLLE